VRDRLELRVVTELAWYQSRTSFDADPEASTAHHLASQEPPCSERGGLAGPQPLLSSFGSECDSPWYDDLRPSHLLGSAANLGFSGCACAVTIVIQPERRGLGRLGMSAPADGELNDDVRPGWVGLLLRHRLRKDPHGKHDLICR